MPTKRCNRSATFHGGKVYRAADKTQEHLTDLGNAKRCELHHPPEPPLLSVKPT